MSKIKQFKDFRSFIDWLVYRFCQWLPDTIYLKIRYWLKMHKHLNLKKPKTFTEKLQWLKLYNRNPNYIKMVDKVQVKEYVSSLIGSKYVIPLLGVWDKPEEIDWASLPEQFVLKANNSGGNMGVVICRDKKNFDVQRAIRMLSKSLEKDIFRDMREWPYKNVPKRVFAEKYIAPNNDARDLADYKWYCFNGEPTFCQVIQDRTTNETIDFFDVEWNHQNFIGLNPSVTPSVTPIEKPKNLETHLYIARALSKGIPFSRIDLYDTGSCIYFGEITLYPASGIGFFVPQHYDTILGNMIRLDDLK